MTVRELHGWSPRTVTLAADGSVLSVSKVEPRFTAGEVAVLLASRRLEREPRGQHGVRLADATDPKNHGRFRAEPVVDYAQDALEKAQAARRAALANPDDDYALLWSVSLEGAEAASG